MARESDYKIKAMHKKYGTDLFHRCGECCNFVRNKYDKTYFKCLAYGESKSSDTDWRMTYNACGLFGKPFNGFRPLKDVLKHEPLGQAVTPLDGQIGMEV